MDILERVYANPPWSLYICLMQKICKCKSCGKGSREQFSYATGYLNSCFVSGFWTFLFVLDVELYLVSLIDKTFTS
jgi:hypothetical protein